MAQLTDFASVVSGDWLLTQLHRPEVAIADCRFSLLEPDWGRRQYQQSHIPGAVYFDLNADLSSPAQRHGGRHPLPDPEALAPKLAAAGITRGETWVVAYDDSRLGFAARFWWLLRYLGHDRVAVLNGGFRQWQAAGYPVTADIPLSKAEQPAEQPAGQPAGRKTGQFVPLVRAEMAVDREMVKQRKDQAGVVLVDAREGDRYRGEREPIDPIAGHIPGAVNYPWQDTTDDQGNILATAAQQHRWRDVQNSEEIIVYCGSGVTACVNLLSLELAGLGPARLYPGSWSDWCSYLTTPTE
ncbi:MAG: sulfurtransferase [Cyanobacteria bacterium J069]|nr:MAG: sulfurtransferase [Cyanobacteria bacterium J069]